MGSDEETVLSTTNRPHPSTPRPEEVAAPPPPKGGDVGLRALFGAVVIAVVAGLFLAAGPVPFDYASPAPPRLQVDDDGQFVIVLGSTRTTLSRQESRAQAEALLTRQRQAP